MWRGPIAGGPIVGEQHCGGTLLWGDLLWGEPRCGGTLLCVGLLRGDLLWGNTKWALIKLTTQCSFHGLCRSPHTRVPPFPSRTLSVPRPDWKTGKKGNIRKTCKTHMKNRKIKAGRQGGEEKTGKQHGVHHGGAQLLRGTYCGWTYLWGSSTVDVNRKQEKKEK